MRFTMSSIYRGMQNIPINHTYRFVDHFLTTFFLINCLENLLQQKNFIKSGLSQVHFKPRFLRQGFNYVCLLLVRTL